jgi:hypothetical protein
MAFEYLFRPIHIGQLEIPNRVETADVEVIITWGHNQLSLQFPDQKTLTGKQALLSLRSERPSEKIIAGFSQRFPCPVSFIIPFWEP